MWLNISQIFLKKENRKFIYLFIAFTVVIFNLIAIFGIDILLHDDPGNYNRVIDGDFPWWRVKFNLLDPFKEWVLWQVMAVWPPLARGVYVFFFMIPLSCCIYYLCRTKFGFSRVCASSAAILPHILPFQWHIPAGINMSYPVLGLLLSVFALILGFHYLEKTTPKSWLKLVGAAMCYLIALQLMEQPLFLLPPLALAFFGCSKPNKKHAWLILFLFAAAAVKFIQILSGPLRKPLTAVPIEKILIRIGLYFKWSLPFPNIDPVVITIIYLLIIIIGFILYNRDDHIPFPLINKNFSHMTRKAYLSYLYAFLVCWSISTIVVFISLSDVFSPRYTYMSAFGLNALLIISIYGILHKLFPGKHRLPIFVFISIIIFSGFYRYLNLKAIFTPINNTHKIIVKEINKKEFPLNSQIVISGVKGIPGGWRRASGYFKYALKRKDVNGLIGPNHSSEYYNFDNHFNPRQRRLGNRYKMTGLSMKDPVFLFLMLPEQQKLKQVQYALQWKGKTKHAPWAILKTDKTTGQVSSLTSGGGMNEYLSTLENLKKKGISQADILWGGPPGKEELIRLEREELDPKLFQIGFYEYQFEFKPVEPSRVKGITSMLNSASLSPLAKNISFGDCFQLELVIADEVTDEKGKIAKFLHFLLKSTVNQQINKQGLAVTLLKNRQRTWGNWLKFYPPGRELKTGDYILGTVKVPVNRYNRVDYLGIRLNMVSGPPQWIGLKAMGNHKYKTDQGGFRVLIPVRKSSSE